MSKLSKFNEAYGEPVADMDGPAVCVSAELYTREQATAQFAEYWAEPVNPEALEIQYAHFHGEMYDGEFVKTWWRHLSNDGGNTPMVDRYVNKKGAKPLWVTTYNQACSK